MEIVIFTVFVGATLALIVYIRNLFSQKSVEISEPVPAPAPVITEKEVVKPKKKATERKSKDAKSTFTHKWLMTSLKGHTKRILDMDFSPNGKFLATTAEDETVIVWPVKDFTQKEHRHYRCNVDDSIFVKWSPDSKAFIIQKSIQNCIEVYKMNKKTDGGYEFSSALTFPAKHTTDIIGLDIASNGRFIATCSDKTDLIIWSLKGDVLARVDTYHNLTYCVRVSPCGRFVGTSGFTSDVKVWEVKFSKSGEFEKIGKAFELPGHTSGVYSFAFSPDSTRMATISKDGTWKVYLTSIEYTKGEDASILMSGKFHGDSQHKSIIAISHLGQLVCVAQDKSIWFYSALTGELEGEIHDIHTEPITRVVFDGTGKYVLTSGDKHARVFYNVPGQKTHIQTLKESLQRNLSNSSARERIQQQINEAEQTLNPLLS